MITRKQFIEMVKDAKANPTENSLQSLMDDLGFVEVLLGMIPTSTLDSFAEEDGPLFVKSDINWPVSFEKAD